MRGKKGVKKKKKGKHASGIPSGAPESDLRDHAQSRAAEKRAKLMKKAHNVAGNRRSRAAPPKKRSAQWKTQELLDDMAWLVDLNIAEGEPADDATEAINAAADVMVEAEDLKGRLATSYNPGYVDKEFRKIVPKCSKAVVHAYLEMLKRSFLSLTATQAKYDKLVARNRLEGEPADEATRLLKAAQPLIEKALVSQVSYETDIKEAEGDVNTQTIADDFIDDVHQAKLAVRAAGRAMMDRRREHIREAEDELARVQDLLDSIVERNDAAGAPDDEATAKVVGAINLVGKAEGLEAEMHEHATPEAADTFIDGVKELSGVVTAASDAVNERESRIREETEARMQKLLKELEELDKTAEANDDLSEHVQDVLNDADEAAEAAETAMAATSADQASGKKLKGWIDSVDDLEEAVSRLRGAFREDFADRMGKDEDAFDDLLEQLSDVQHRDNLADNPKDDAREPVDTVVASCATVAQLHEVLDGIDREVNGEEWDSAAGNFISGVSRVQSEMTAAVAALDKRDQRLVRESREVEEWIVIYEWCVQRNRSAGEPSDEATTKLATAGGSTSTASNKLLLADTEIEGGNDEEKGTEDGDEDEDNKRVGLTTETAVAAFKFSRTAIQDVKAARLALVERAKAHRTTLVSSLDTQISEIESFIKRKSGHIDAALAEAIKTAQAAVESAKSARTLATKDDEPLEEWEWTLWIEWFERIDSLTSEMDSLSKEVKQMTLTSKAEVMTAVKSLHEQRERLASLNSRLRTNDQTAEGNAAHKAFSSATETLGLGEALEAEVMKLMQESGDAGTKEDEFLSAVPGIISKIEECELAIDAWDKVTVNRRHDAAVAAMERLASLEKRNERAHGPTDGASAAIAAARKLVPRVFTEWETVEEWEIIEVIETVESFEKAVANAEDAVAERQKADVDKATRALSEASAALEELSKTAEADGIGGDGPVAGAIAAARDALNAIAGRSKDAATIGLGDAATDSPGAISYGFVDSVNEVMQMVQQARTVLEDSESKAAASEEHGKAEAALSRLHSLKQRNVRAGAPDDEASKKIALAEGKQPKVLTEWDPTVGWNLVEVRGSVERFIFAVSEAEEDVLERQKSDVRGASVTLQKVKRRLETIKNEFMEHKDAATEGAAAALEGLETAVRSAESQEEAATTCGISDWESKQPGDISYDFVDEAKACVGLADTAEHSLHDAEAAHEVAAVYADIAATREKFMLVQARNAAAGDPEDDAAGAVRAAMAALPSWAAEGAPRFAHADIDAAREAAAAYGAAVDAAEVAVRGRQKGDVEASAELMHGYKDQLLQLIATDKENGSPSAAATAAIEAAQQLIAKADAAYDGRDADEMEAPGRNAYAYCRIVSGIDEALKLVEMEISVANKAAAQAKIYSDMATAKERYKAVIARNTAAGAPADDATALVTTAGASLPAWAEEGAEKLKPADVEKARAECSAFVKAVADADIAVRARQTRDVDAAASRLKAHKEHLIELVALNKEAGSPSEGVNEALASASAAVAAAETAYASRAENDDVQPGANAYVFCSAVGSLDEAIKVADWEHALANKAKAKEGLVKRAGKAKAALDAAVSRNEAAGQPDDEGSNALRRAKKAYPADELEGSDLEAAAKAVAEFERLATEADELTLERQHADVRGAREKIQEARSRHEAFVEENADGGAPEDEASKLISQLEEALSRAESMAKAAAADDGDSASPGTDAYAYVAASAEIDALVAATGRAIANRGAGIAEAVAESKAKLEDARALLAQMKATNEAAGIPVDDATDKITEASDAFVAIDAVDKLVTVDPVSGPYKELLAMAEPTLEAVRVAQVVLAQREAGLVESIRRDLADIVARDDAHGENQDDAKDALSEAQLSVAALEALDMSNTSALVENSAAIMAAQSAVAKAAAAVKAREERMLVDAATRVSKQRADLDRLKARNTAQRSPADKGTEALEEALIILGDAEYLRENIKKAGKDAKLEDLKTYFATLPKLEQVRAFAFGAINARGAMKMLQSQTSMKKNAAERRKEAEGKLDGLRAQLAELQMRQVDWVEQHGEPAADDKATRLLREAEKKVEQAEAALKRSQEHPNSGEAASLMVTRVEDGVMAVALAGQAMSEREIRHREEVENADLYADVAKCEGLLALLKEKRDSLQQRNKEAGEPNDDATRAIAAADEAVNVAEGFLDTLKSEPPHRRAFNSARFVPKVEDADRAVRDAEKALHDRAATAARQLQIAASLAIASIALKIGIDKLDRLQCSPQLSAASPTALESAAKDAVYLRRLQFALREDPTEELVQEFLVGIQRFSAFISSSALTKRRLLPPAGAAARASIVASAKPLKLGASIVTLQRAGERVARLNRRNDLVDCPLDLATTRIDAANSCQLAAVALQLMQFVAEEDESVTYMFVTLVSGLPDKVEKAEDALDARGTHHAAGSRPGSVQATKDALAVTAEDGHDQRFTLVVKNMQGMARTLGEQRDRYEAVSDSVHALPDVADTLEEADELLTMAETVVNAVVDKAAAAERGDTVSPSDANPSREAGDGSGSDAPPMRALPERSGGRPRRRSMFTAPKSLIPLFQVAPHVVDQIEGAVATLRVAVQRITVLLDALVNRAADMQQGLDDSTKALVEELDKVEAELKKCRAEYSTMGASGGAGGEGATADSATTEMRSKFDELEGAAGESVAKAHSLVAEVLVPAETRTDRRACDVAQLVSTVAVAAGYVTQMWTIVRMMRRSSEGTSIVGTGVLPDRDEISFVRDTAERSAAHMEQLQLRLSALSVASWVTQRVLGVVAAKAFVDGSLRCIVTVRDSLAIAKVYTSLRGGTAALLMGSRAIPGRPGGLIGEEEKFSEDDWQEMTKADSLARLLLVVLRTLVANAEKQAPTDDKSVLVNYTFTSHENGANCRLALLRRRQELYCARAKERASIVDDKMDLKNLRIQEAQSNAAQSLALAEASHERVRHSMAGSAAAQRSALVRYTMCVGEATAAVDMFGRMLEGDPYLERIYGSHSGGSGVPGGSADVVWGILPPNETVGEEAYMHYMKHRLSARGYLGLGARALVGRRTWGRYVMRRSRRVRYVDIVAHLRLTGSLYNHLIGEARAASLARVPVDVGVPLKRRIVSATRQLTTADRSLPPPHERAQLEVTKRILLAFNDMVVHAKFAVYQFEYAMRNTIRDLQRIRQMDRDAEALIAREEMTLMQNEDSRLQSLVRLERNRLEGNVRTLARQIEILDEERSNLEEKAREARRAAMSASGRMMASAEKSGLQLQIKELQHKQDKLAARLEEAQKELEDAGEAGEEREVVARLTETLDALSREKHLLRMQLQRADEERSNAKRMADAEEVEISRMREEVEMVQREKDALADRLREMEARVAEAAEKEAQQAARLKRALSDTDARTELSNRDWSGGSPLAAASSARDATQRTLPKNEVAPQPALKEPAEGKSASVVAHTSSIQESATDGAADGAASHTSGRRASQQDSDGRRTPTANESKAEVGSESKEERSNGATTSRSSSHGDGKEDHKHEESGFRSSTDSDGPSPLSAEAEAEAKDDGGASESKTETHATGLHRPSRVSSAVSSRSGASGGVDFASADERLSKAPQSRRESRFSKYTESSEEEKKELEEDAACVIQAVHRGKRDRRVAEHRRGAAIAIQAQGKGFVQRHRFERLKQQHLAATGMQKLARGKLGRRKAMGVRRVRRLNAERAKKRDAAVSIQRIMRGKLARNVYDGLYEDARPDHVVRVEAATKIEAAFRGHATRKKIGPIKQAIRRRHEQVAAQQITRVGKGRVARRRVEMIRDELWRPDREERLHGAMSLQRIIRRRKAINNINNLRVLILEVVMANQAEERRQRAAARIQALHRGTVARERVDLLRDETWREDREERWQAAMNMQRLIRRGRAIKWITWLRRRLLTMHRLERLELLGHDLTHHELDSELMEQGIL